MENSLRRFAGFSYKPIDLLSTEKREKLAFISHIAASQSDSKMVELLLQYNLKRNFALGKYRDYKEFVNDEVFHSCEELFRTDIKCDWEEIESELFMIQEGNVEPKDMTSSRLDDDEYFNKLFWKVIVWAGLDEEYLNLEIDYKNTWPGYYNTSQLRNFDLVIDWLGRYRWLLFLKNLRDTGKYNVPAEHIKAFPSLPECFKNKDDFYRYIQAPQVEDLYDTHEDGTYHLKIGKKVYLAGFAHRLKDTGKLIDEIKTNQDLAKVFCTFFHINFNRKEEKQFQPDRAKTDDFLFIK